MEGFRFSIPYTVRVGDVNYGGHAGNAAVLNFFQDARIAYLANLGPFTELDIGEGCGVILPEAHVYYRKEMFLGDELTIAVRVGEVRRSAVVMQYEVRRGAEIMAEGVTNLLSFDYERRKARRLPDVFRQALLEYEGLEDRN